MSLRVLDASVPADYAAWKDAWEAWPERDVMAHPGFARLFARPVDRAVALLWGEGPGAILAPLILRPLSAEPWAPAGEARWDAVTPYGYGGPYALGPGPRDDAGWARAVEDWTSRERLVTTFVRLSLFPEQLAALPYVPSEKLPNVVVPLGGGPDGLWSGYEGKVRKWVKTAEAAGVTVEVDRDGSSLDDFHDVYTHTMTRNQAVDWYFFPKEFFRRIVADLAGHFAFFNARLGGKVVSTDLVLCSRRHVYYFLGGTLDEAFDHGPNYLVKHRVALWAIGEGKTSYVLGGGYEAGDGLFRYKRAYARGGIVPFRVGCVVHDEAAAAELSAARAAYEKKAGKDWAPRPDYFPPYRS